MLESAGVLASQKFGRETIFIDAELVRIIKQN